MSRKKTVIICIIILAVAAVVTAVVFLTEPTAKREGATKKTAMLVSTIKVDRGNFQPTIVATGTVQAARDIVLSPRVSGEIVDLSQSFVPGGYVKKGEMLLQIDPADFENNLQLRKSDLEQQKAQLRLEMGQQEVAEQDYALIGDSLSAGNQELVLRKPQLRSAKALVDAAEASVRQAELNLDRTGIRAPFDAHILSRMANVGSQVTPGQNMGRLVGMDEYWVVANVPLSKIRWLRFPKESNERGSEVRIANRTAWKTGEYRTGYLDQLIGALDDQTRLARIIVSVPDPHLIKTDTTDLPQLIIGAFVETRIQADTISDVTRLNRDYLRKNETVWVMANDKLEIREVSILLKDEKYVYITAGLDDGDEVVTTNLATVTEGAALRKGGAENKSTEDSSKTNDHSQ